MSCIANAAPGPARRGRSLFRDRLLIALLIARPLRRANMAALRLGTSLQRRGAAWWIVLGAEETKTGRAIEAPVPDALAGPIDTYLAVHRPVLLAGRVGGDHRFLWLTKDGTWMRAHAVHARVTRQTARHLGVAVNPHLFRDCAATSIALDDPAHVLVTKEVLGHASLEISRRFYNQAQSHEEDQLRLSRELAARLGLEVAGEFVDRALSAATTRRPGYQAMLEHVRAGGTDVVLAEGLDRLSRDQEDVAALHKRLSFLGVRLVTVAEGEVGDLHVGLKGAMNALYLKDLAQKTRRGLEGRVRQGRSAGGLCYGYAVVHETGADGPVHGRRRIVAEEAAVVRRVFAEFAGGSSPKAIAKRLNAESVPGPRGERWRDGTIRGHRTRGTGLLNNELYAGGRVWHRQRYVKDPASGKRLARPNPPEAWVAEEVPDLRIIDDDLWARAKARQGELDADPKLRKAKATRFWEHRRAKHLLTGLLVCGACGHVYASVGRDYLACVGARTLDVCDQRRGLRRGAAEDAILEVVRGHLLQPEAVQAFVASYTEEVNRRRDEALGRRRGAEAKLARAEGKLRGLYDAIAEGLRTPGLLGQLQELEAERDRLAAILDEPAPTPVRLHPNLPELYRRKVARLRDALQEPSIRDEAVDLLRGLMTKVTVRPGDGCVELVVEGALTAMLALAAGARAEQFASRSTSTAKVVAGARNH